MLSVADQATQVLTVGLGIFGDEGFERFVVADDETVAPALQGMEAFVVLPGRGVDLIDQRQDRFGVLAAHQLTDVLQVAFASDMGRMLGSVGERLAQGIGQRQAVQQLRLEGRQAFAELL